MQLLQEKVNLMIKEAMKDEFNINLLTTFPSYKKAVDYCTLMLGKPIGNGSSRIVFQIDDEKVLKLAKNEKGLAQNDFEYDVYRAASSDLVPKVFDVENHDLYLISEFVLPAKKSDFPQCLGVKFEEFVDFLRRADYYVNNNRLFSMMSKERFEELLETNEWFHELYELIGNTNISVADLVSLRNLGLTVRDGQPTIVILDGGLNEHIYNSYYKR